MLAELVGRHMGRILWSVVHAVGSLPLGQGARRAQSASTWQHGRPGRDLVSPGGPRKVPELGRDGSRTWPVTVEAASLARVCCGGRGCEWFQVLGIAALTNCQGLEVRCSQLGLPWLTDNLSRPSTPCVTNPREHLVYNTGTSVASVSDLSTLLLICSLFGVQLGCLAPHQSAKVPKSK